MCSNTAVFSKTVAMLGSVEENTALSRALSQLAEVEDKMEQLHQQQAFSDFFILAELLADYIRLLGAVRVREHNHIMPKPTIRAHCISNVMLFSMFFAILSAVLSRG